MKQALLVTTLLAAVIFTGCDKDDDNDYNNNPPAPQSTVVKGTGSITDMDDELAQFRALIGDPLNNTPNQTIGRREVNWDGVGVINTNNNNFPRTFFNDTTTPGNNNRKRGLEYINNGTTFRIDSSNFKEIDLSYENEFFPFSNKRLLVAAGTVFSEAEFKLAGTGTPAFVCGFGVVFSDVDDANSTTVEFFNGNKSLGVFKAPAKTAGGSFSFLGVFFPNEKITRVKIKAGTAALAPGIMDVSDGGTNDLVAYDDFFYDEPKILQ